MHNKIKNKRGQATIFLFIFGFVCLACAIIIGIFGITFSKMNDQLDRDIDLGQVNLATLNSKYFGVFYTSFINNADFYGMCVIIGMTFGLFLSSYFLRNKFPKIAILFDILLILGAFFLSLYISSSYQLILDGLNSAGEPFLETYMPKTSTFILNLPIWTCIIGAFTMVLMHSSIPRRKEENIQEGGFLQGVQ